MSNGGFPTLQIGHEDWLDTMAQRAPFHFRPAYTVQSLQEGGLETCFLSYWICVTTKEVVASDVRYCLLIMFFI